MGSHSIAATSRSSVSELSSSPMLTVVYVGVLLFCFVHFFRPQDFSPTLAFVPLAKIIGIFTGAALIAAMAFESVRLPREAKLLIALVAYLSLCIPFSTWRGGSFDVVVDSFSKVVVIAVATMVAVNTLQRLRCLMVLQTLAMVTMGIVAITEPKHAGRMYGAGNLFSDPNDFALNLCIVLPFSVALLMSCRSRVTKILWSSVIGFIIFTIISTVSRGGFLALIVTTVAMWNRFRLGARTISAVSMLFVVSMTFAITAVGPSSFADRLATIAAPQTEASASAHQELLMRSIELTFKHPIFGIGPGQFEEVSGTWHVTHNSYTQLSAEAGIPALVMFVALVWGTFKSLRLQNEAYRGTEAWYFVSSLYCAMAGYIVGAFFLSTAYLFFPYILMAYCFAVSRIVTDPLFGAGEKLSTSMAFTKGYDAAPAIR
jgi:O-antigen ligase